MSSANPGMFVCTYCGSDEVTDRTDVSWNVKTQQWESDGADGDCCYCNYCDDTDLIWLSFSELDKTPVGTEMAVLVDETGPDWVHRRDKAAPIAVTSNGTNYFLNKLGDVCVDDLVILRKCNRWQWEVVND